MPKITAVFAFDHYGVFNANSDLYNESEYGAYIAYGIDKKWYGFKFRFAHELEAFNKSRNFIYILDCNDINIRVYSRNTKEKASTYAREATQALNYKYGVENDQNIPENKMKVLAATVADLYTVESSKNAIQEAGLFRKKSLENYLQGNGKVKLYASLDIDGYIEVNMPNFTSARDYFKEHPDKLIALLIEQNALKVDMRTYRIRESNQ